MAKRKKTASRKQHTLKPLVRQIDTHIRRLKAMKAKKRATPQEKKQLDKHIGHLRRVKMLTMDGCDDFFLP